MAGDSKSKKEDEKGKGKNSKKKNEKDKQIEKNNESKENVENKEEKSKNDKETDENKKSTENEDENSEDEEDNQSKTEDFRKKEETAKEEIIQEFIAPMDEEQDEDEIGQQEEHRPMRVFHKRKMMRKKKFSISNLDEYLHYKYRKINKNIRLLVEMIIVVFLFMLFPSILLIWKKPKKFKVSQIFDIKNKDKVIGFFRENLFCALTYVFFIASTIFMEYSLRIFASMLTAFDIKIEGFVADFLEVLKLYSYYLRNFMAFSMVFMLSNVLIQPYALKAKTITIAHLFITLIFWFSILSAVLFLEKCIVNFLTSEMKKSSFRNRIWAANFKSFVFKKLAAIAEAVPKGNYETHLAIKSVQNEFDPGYFLRHNDVDLTTKEKAEGVAESIFAYLDIDHFDYDKIQEFFPERPVEVMQYLGHTARPPEDIIIDFETLRKRAIELHKERKDISRSLIDRDSIIRKLDFILLFLVFFLSFLGFLFLLNVDYKFYLASIGPFLFAFSWVFQDNIKDLYKCFVFHLISHPYDVGDRVIIDDQQFIVRKIDLLYTTFTDNNNRISYMPNPSLFLKKIDNIRRTWNQFEEMIVLIAGNTSFSKIESILQKLKKNCEEKDSLFTGHVEIRETVKQDGKLKLIIGIEHKGNFQELSERPRRRIDCFDVVEKTLRDVNVSFEENIEFTTQ